MSWMLTPLDCQALLGRYASLDTESAGRVFFCVIKTKLTPNLGTFAPLIQDELEHALTVEMPEAQGKNMADTHVMKV